MKHMIMLLMILLASGCVSKAKLKIIKADIKRSDIRPVIWCDIVIADENLNDRCRCRCFDLDDYKRVPDSRCDSKEGEFVTDNYDVSVCNRIGGTYLETWNTEIRPNIKRLKKIREKYIR